MHNRPSVVHMQAVLAHSLNALALIVSKKNSHENTHRARAWSSPLGPPVLLLILRVRLKFKGKLRTVLTTQTKLLLGIRFRALDAHRHTNKLQLPDGFTLHRRRTGRRSRNTVQIH
jgi:hypothetical protein